jgi:sRNA-binding carbon storage regulator CsrA
VYRREVYVAIQQEREDELAAAAQLDQEDRAVGGI